jgi:hypothetical protein
MMHLIKTCIPKIKIGCLLYQTNLADHWFESIVLCGAIHYFHLHRLIHEHLVKINHYITLIWSHSILMHF